MSLLSWYMYKIVGSVAPLQLQPFLRMATSYNNPYNKPASSKQAMLKSHNQFVLFCFCSVPSLFFCYTKLLLNSKPRNSGEVAQIIQPVLGPRQVKPGRNILSRCVGSIVRFSFICSVIWSLSRALTRCLFTIRIENFLIISIYVFMQMTSHIQV